MADKWRRARPIYLEDTANGPAILSVLKNRIPGLVPLQAQGSKVSRAYSVTPYIESGNVYIPHPKNNGWVKDFINECTRFPEGDSDDQVDAMSQGLNELFNGKNLKPSRSKPRGF
jgi:predicted phage terminase large subunit-like protein